MRLACVDQLSLTISWGFKYDFKPFGDVGFDFNVTGLHRFEL
jgi:hypothetical protein